MDYWVWEAIEAVPPRVGFARADHAVNSGTNDYVGGSLAAMVKLGAARGTASSGRTPWGFNAFFVRDDVGGELMPEVEPKDCLTHPWNVYGEQVRYPRVAGMEWVEV